MEAAVMAEIDRVLADRGQVRYLASLQKEDKWGEWARQLEPELNRVLNGIRGELYEKPDQRIYFCFSDSLNISGVSSAIYVDGHPGVDFMSISLGAFRRIHHFYHRLLSFPDNFPLYGNPAKENSMKDFPPLNDFTLGDESSPIPSDKARACLAVELSRISLYFMVFHEFSHLLLGHCDLATARKQNASINEAIREAKADDKALELEADKEAIFRSIIYFLDVFTHKKMPPTNLNEQAICYIYNSIGSTYFNLIFCIYLGFRFYLGSSLSGPSFNPKLKFELRIFAAMGAFERFCELYLSEHIPIKDFRLAVQGLLIEAERCFATSADEEPNFSLIEAIYLDGPKRKEMETQLRALKPSCRFWETLTIPLARMHIPKDRPFSPDPGYVD